MNPFKKRTKKSSSISKDFLIWPSCLPTIRTALPLEPLARAHLQLALYKQNVHLNLELCSFLVSHPASLLPLHKAQSLSIHEWKMNWIQVNRLDVNFDWITKLPNSLSKCKFSSTCSTGASTYSASRLASAIWNSFWRLTQNESAHSSFGLSVIVGKKSKRAL